MGEESRYIGKELMNMEGTRDGTGSERKKRRGLCMFISRERQ